MFDSHAHYDSKEFNVDREELLIEVNNSGVEYILNAGANIKSSKMCVELAEKYDFIYASVGVHPHDARGVKPDYLDTLVELSRNKKVVAIGEIGLDYHYDFSPRDLQIKCFIEQVDLAKQLKLPVIMHDRESHEDITKIIKQSNVSQTGGVLHCFSGSLEMAKEITKEGIYLGIGGPLTFSNARKIVEVVENIPIEFLLSETDCPYLTPVPFRGQRNDSRYMRYTIEKIAHIKGLSFEETDEILINNAKRLFNIQ